MERPSSPPTPTPPVTPRFGISIRLFLVLVAVAIGPLLAVGSWMIDRSLEAVQRGTRELQLAVVADVQRTVARELALSRLELNALAQILLAEGYGDDARRIDLASSQLAASERLDWISIYAPNKDRIGSLKAKDAASPPDIEIYPEELLPLFDLGPFAVGKVFDGGDYPAVLITTRLEVNGRIRGYLLAGSSLRPICDVLADISNDRFGNVQDSAYLVDGEFRVIAHPDPVLAATLEPRAERGVLKPLEGQSLLHVPLGISPEFVTPEGEERLGALESIPDLGWAVVVEVPRAVAYASSKAMRRSMLFVAGGMALLMLVASGILAGTITRPVKELLQGTQRLAQRRFDTRVDVSGSDEIGMLARSFNKMVEDLQSSEQKLQVESRIRNDLSRYLSPEVVEEIVKHPEKMKLGGERRTITVMFADIVGFTGHSERLEPEVIVSILNELFTIATEIVIKHGGIIDKFIGDCTMAVFGAPEAHWDDARRAVQAAEDILRWLEVGNRRWARTYGFNLELAIGINTGTVVAGNIGSQKRMEYTVIGDTVNIAARLESLARPGQILITQATLESLGPGFIARAIGLQQVSGRTGTTMIYAIDAE